MRLEALASLYGDKGQYARAESLFTRALAIRERALGPDHPEVAASLNNLGFVYASQQAYSAGKSGGGLRQHGRDRQASSVRSAREENSSDATMSKGCC